MRDRQRYVHFVKTRSLWMCLAGALASGCGHRRGGGGDDEGDGDADAYAVSVYGYGEAYSALPPGPRGARSRAAGSVMAMTPVAGGLLIAALLTACSGPASPPHGPGTAHPATPVRGATEARGPEDGSGLLAAAPGLGEPGSGPSTLTVAAPESLPAGRLVVAEVVPPALPPAVSRLVCTRTPVAVTDGSTFASAPSIAPTPEGLGIVWAERVNDGNCAFERFHLGLVDARGRLQGARRILTSQPAGNTQIAWTGAELVATYGVLGTGLELVRLGGDGALLQAPVRLGIVTDFHQLEVRGRELWIGWSAGGTFRMRRFDLRGAPLGPEVPFQTPTRSGGTLYFRFLLAENEVVLSWGADGEHHARFGLDGAPIGPPTRFCCPSTGSWSIAGLPALAPLGPGTAVFWGDTSRRPRPLMMTRFDRTGRWLAEGAIGRESWTSDSIAAARASEVGLAWRSRDLPGLRFARIGADGSPIGNEKDLAPGAGAPGCGTADWLAMHPTDRGWAVAWSAARDRQYRVHLAHVCAAELRP